MQTWVRHRPTARALEFDFYATDRGRPASLGDRQASNPLHENRFSNAAFRVEALLENYEAVVT
jgi:hypothetical protein